MAKTLEFVWDGVAYTVPKLLVIESEAFFELQEKMAAEDVPTGEKYEAAIALVKLMKCPDAILEVATVDELQELIVALQLAHFGIKKQEGDASPPDAGTP